MNFYFTSYDGYSSTYLCKEYGSLAHLKSWVLQIADLLVHVIYDLEVLCLLMFIQRLHVCWLLLSLLKKILRLVHC